MQNFLLKLIEKYDPTPAGRSDLISLINAGEEAVALEIATVNYYENDVAISPDEKTKLIQIARYYSLSQDYLDMIENLPMSGFPVSDHAE